MMGWDRKNHKNYRDAKLYRREKGEGEGGGGVRVTGQKARKACLGAERVRVGIC